MRTDPSARIIVVGAGRLGRAIAPALSRAGYQVVGPVGRGDAIDAIGARDVVLLCVPDDAIAGVAATIAAEVVIGHCSGALGLDVLGAHDGFSMHPLLSITGDETDFAGAACAVAGRSTAALGTARAIGGSLGMSPIEVPESGRALYHAAASMASNFLVTVEDTADRLAASTGVQRRHLARLAQSALENWARLGGPDALTGPIARGDEATIARQRGAVQASTPDLLPLWDALSEETRRLAARRHTGEAR